MTKHSFEAETGKILELLTHSIYSNKEIFLRELISNASDAIDKARLKSLTDTTFLGDDSNFEVKITLDNEKNIITIEDNGIGMTEDELHKCIGTIAKSGTGEFLEKLKKAKEDGEHNLIGQFGVGFYSSFMVADKVELETKSPLDSKAHRWISDGKSDYEVSESDKTSRGTIVRLFIDESNKDLVTEWKIKELIKKYSNYTPIPIMLEEDKKEEGKDGGEGKVIGKEFKRINETKSIWTKSKSEIKKEEYFEFYKTVSMDFTEPLTYIHNNVEGLVSYKSLIFIPKEKNMFANMGDPNRDFGLKLYVQNVLILENAKELIPVWLRFISGVVETTDIALNISREMLQSNIVLEKIKKGIVKKVVSELKKQINENSLEYDVFLTNYGNILKEGIHYEYDIKEEIAEVIKFKSMLIGKNISLDEYLEKNNGSNDRKEIYYIIGKSESEVLSNPYLSQFREANVDVLLLTEHIDSFVVQGLIEYKGNKLKSVTGSDIKLKEETLEEKEKLEKNKIDFKDFLELTKNIIGTDKLEKIELNEKLGDSLGAIKTPENGINPQMEEMMKAMGQPVPPQKRILELNPNHSIVIAMKSEFTRDLKSEKLTDMINYAYDSAILLEGGKLNNMGEFIKKVNLFAGGYLK